MHHLNRFDLGLGDTGTCSSGGKRLFDQVEGDETQGLPRQRPRLPNLPSVVLEAIQMDHLQKICSSLEPILRKVVGEEVERALARLLPNRLEPRTSPDRIQGSTQSDLCLYFTSKLSLPLFTGGKVEGEGGLPVHIILKDDFTKEVVTTGPWSSAKLEVVVLDGDFANEDEDWTMDDFEKYVVKERDGKRPLLAGDLNISLKDGVGTLGDLVFTDNSSWIRSRKFRLGVRVARGFGEGVRIKESKTEAFTVKDHRGELYKKHYPPNLNDDVWRLDRIGKDGAFHKRLQDQNIRTVEDFLRLYMMDQHKLRTILGNGMSNKMWENTIEHAKTCLLSGKLYVYYADMTHNIGVIFNNIYELLGVTSNNTYKSADSLDEKEKVYVDKLVKLAYENWADMVEYENLALGNESSSKHGPGHSEIESNRMNHELTGVFNQPMSLNQQSGQLQSVSTPTSIMASSGRPSIYGYGSESAVGYANQGSQIFQTNQAYNSAVDLHSQSPSIISVHSFATNSGPSSTGVSRGPQPIWRSFGEYPTAAMSQSNWASLQTPDFYVNEEDIRAQAANLLNNDEMQQQLLLYPFIRAENSQLQGENGYFEGFNPSPAYREDGVRSSGKGYVGWLKLKAALRWGIFIRRKIAEKKAIQRAQLEEIED